jgi:glutamyl-tRNA synthetase/glutamyl-Q tRNA(Asp) synthetase
MPPYPLGSLDLAQIPAHPTTRFAPSPTGFLHLGHVANAVWTWGVAQATAGRVLLRIEDHDRGRCRPEYEAALLEDLEWLGLEPDRASRASLDTDTSSFRQSDSQVHYRAALDQLRARGAVYACGCSRKTVAAMAAPSDGDAEEQRYLGTCRTRGLAPGPGRRMRVVLPPAAVSWHDLHAGPIEQCPAEQCGDLVVQDASGNWTYQFCVTVDDLRHGVDLVVRGADLLASTGRQILLGEMLGRARPPRYLHHPLVLNPDGMKWSKREGAKGIREFRRQGWTAERLLGEAAYRTGLLAEPRPLRAAELGELFIKR